MDIKKLPKRTLILRTHIGEGTFGNDKFTLTMSPNGSALFVEIKGIMYRVTVKSIVEDVFEFRKFRKKVSGR